MNKFKISCRVVCFVPIVYILLSSRVFSQDMSQLNMHSEIHSRPNPFFAQTDPYRVTKESFRLYTKSITRAQFDIAVFASDTIARVLAVASGWHINPIGSFLTNVPVKILNNSPYFIENYGRLANGLTVGTTDFLSISESKIAVKTLFFSMNSKTRVEVLDVFVFKREGNGWIFDGYDPSRKEFPCVRPKVWQGQPSTCQPFER